MATEPYSETAYTVRLSKSGSLATDRQGQFVRFHRIDAIRFAKELRSEGIKCKTVRVRITVEDE
jgi:hypothetical protein